MKRVAVSCGDPKWVQSCLAALASFGIEPVIVTPKNPVLDFSAVNGLLLPGGLDIDPAFYGQDRLRECGRTDSARDRMDIGLAKKALGLNIPVLGICRGMQILNIALGGTLIQHLPTTGQHRVQTEDKGVMAHTVVLDPQSRLAGIFNGTTVGVNSRHHQAIDRLGERVIVTGRCPDDGVIEAIDVPGKRFAIGVQWHPEDMAASDPIQRRLFAAFAAAL